MTWYDMVCMYTYMPYMPPHESTHDNRMSQAPRKPQWLGLIGVDNPQLSHLTWGFPLHESHVDMKSYKNMKSKYIIYFNNRFKIYDFSATNHQI